MDFEKILEQMSSDNSPRSIAQAELSALFDAYLSRLVQITTVASNMHIIDPVTAKE